MINITEHQHSIVQDILRRSLHDCEVLAFGSRLSTSNKKSSDLDLAIIGHQGFSLLQLYELREKFSESELPFRVDIIDWNAISPEFRKVISTRCEKL